MSIQVDNISKNYGKVEALKSVSFTINKGEIVGFLGPNGAGKSTLMKILTGYTQPSSGKALINDLSCIDEITAVKQKIGYLPEHNPLYLDLYIKEYLQFSAAIYKIDKSRIDEVIVLTGLSSETTKKIGQLSKGYRQRVGIANALLHDPEVLILDEPTTGLDPNQLIEIRALIKKIGQNKTVILSTHIMQEVEAICNRILLLNKGELVADKQIETIRNENQNLDQLFQQYTK